jgi:hypothetical protein
VEPPPPPPPPKCEDLAEGCVAKAGLQATLHPIEWRLEPPVGWKYAVESAEIVTVSDPSAALAVTTFEGTADKKPANVKARSAKRDETVARLSEKLGITVPKKLAFPSKPHRASKVHGVDMALYQFDGAARSGEKGPLLVMFAQVVPERVLVGVAFVAEKDTTNADAAVLKAIDSLEPTTAPATEDAGAPAPK